MTKRRRSKRRKQLWSNAERMKLDELLACRELTIPEIAVLLGRSENSVKSYMRRHKLRRWPAAKSRNCLNCGRVFTVRYKFNYLCPRCKLDPSWTTLADREPA